MFQCQSQALGCNVLVDGGSGSCLEDPADIGTAHEKVGRKILQCQWLPDVGVDMGKDLIHLCMILGSGLFFWFLILLGASGNKRTVQKNHHFYEKCLVKKILPGAFTGLELMDKIHKTCLFFRIQMDTVWHMGVTETETVVQVRFLCGEPCKIFRVNGKNDPLVGLLIDLGQVMALKLVDKKD